MAARVAHQRYLAQLAVKYSSWTKHFKKDVEAAVSRLHTDNTKDHVSIPIYGKIGVCTGFCTYFTDLERHGCENHVYPLEFSQAELDHLVPERTLRVCDQFFGYKDVAKVRVAVTMNIAP